MMKPGLIFERFFTGFIQPGIKITPICSLIKKEWASKMINIIFDIKEKVDLSEENFLKEDLISAFIRKYDKIIKEGYKANPPPKKNRKTGTS